MELNLLKDSRPADYNFSWIQEPDARDPSELSLVVRRTVATLKPELGPQAKTWAESCSAAVCRDRVGLREGAIGASRASDSLSVQ